METLKTTNKILLLIIYLALPQITTGSPCIDAGDPNFIVDANAPNDIDGEDRIIGGRVDIGADEFLDSDGDGLPDFWELLYFGDSNIADANDDPDEDGIPNIDEYELYSSHPNAPPYYVDSNNIGDPCEDGSLPHPFDTIAEGIDAADDGDTVLVAAGTYTGPNNIDVNFGGKLPVLYAPDGPSVTIIDCNSSGRGFDFHSGETPAAAVVGFTITNGQADYGGAINCYQSSPQFRDCVITSNSDPNYGVGGIYCYLATPTFASCDIINNGPEGIRMEYGSAKIEGTVNLSFNDLVASNIMLYGDGTIQMDSTVTLDLTDSRIRCNISGPGTIQVDLDSELIIESDAVIDLGHETDPNLNGQIQCDGLLRLRQDATVMDAQVHVSRASFEDDAIILNSVVTAEAGSPYGQFYIEDNVVIMLSKIVSDGDRYLDLDPTEFDVNNIHIGTIDVNITEGVGGTQGGLFELRGKPDLVSSIGCDPNNEFFCQAAPGTIPPFDPNNWTINKLELIADAKLNLTNRFDFQVPYDLEGDDETLYVKHLILGPNSVLNTAFQQIYYDTLDMHPTAKVVNIPLLGFSLVNISFDSEIDYLTRVKHNNFEHPFNPSYNRIHIDRVTSQTPDSNGMMRMRNLIDMDPDSSTYNQVINARAKGLFSKVNEDEVDIMFEYLFETSDPNTELVVYLTDSVELMDPCAPGRSAHYTEVARIQLPPAGRPGSFASSRFAVFSGSFPRGDLDFTRGTYVELELVGPVNSSCLINNWDPIICIYCGDVTGDQGVTVLDFLTTASEYGAAISTGAYGYDCTFDNSAFSSDGYVGSSDCLVWDWGDVLRGRPGFGSFCPSSFYDPIIPMDGSGSVEQSGGLDGCQGQGPLLIGGKRYEPNYPDDDYLSDRLYWYDANGILLCGPLAAGNDRLNGRLVMDHLDQIYQLNLEDGLVRLSDEVSVVPQASFTDINEPRYNGSATVYVSLQGSGVSWSGHPILDAAFDPSGFVYVTPVVVDPVSNDAYLASAKLQLIPPSDYNIVQLYDDPNIFNPDDYDNPNLRGLSEIEIDNSGNLYVINMHAHNESDILWVYDSDTGEVKQRLDLVSPDNPDIHIPAPVGMHVSDATGKLYLASSLNQAEADSVLLYVLDTSDLSFVRSVSINNMGHITDITEDPVTNDIWVVGFKMEDIPDYLNVNDDPFYKPYLAKVPYGTSGPVNAVWLTDTAPEPNLAMPLSIIWTGQVDECDGADLDGLGSVDYIDYAILAGQWYQPPGSPSADIAPESPDNFVDLLDLAVLVENWLRTDCN